MNTPVSGGLHRRDLVLRRLQLAGQRLGAEAERRYAGLGSRERSGDSSVLLRPA